MIMYTLIQWLFNTTYSHHGYKPTLIVPSFNTLYGRRSFSVAGPRLFNKLPAHITAASTVDLFKREMKTFMFTLSRYELDKLLVVS